MITKALLYCTKNSKTKLSSNSLQYYVVDNKEYKDYMGNWNGKVVAVCDIEVEKFDFISTMKYENDALKYNEEVNKLNTICHKACMSAIQMVHYLDTKCLGTKNPNGMNGYAIHITKLEIFDEPKELSEFRHYNKPSCDSCPFQYSVDCDYHREVECDDIPLTKAPQNMCYVWYKGEKYALISIQPQWLVKILNGEKDIEVRKKVLREMIK